MKDSSLSGGGNGNKGIKGDRGNKGNKGIKGDRGDREFLQKLHNTRKLAFKEMRARQTRKPPHSLLKITFERGYFAPNKKASPQHLKKIGF